MSFPRYERYKDSGVEWLGEVPEHWIPKKIAAISSLKGRLGWQGLKADEYRDHGPYVVSSAHFDNHQIDWDACPRVSQERFDIDSNIQLAPNDVLLMKDGAAMGKLAFVDNLPGPACLNSHLLLFRPVNAGGYQAYFPRFAFYYMQTGLFQEYIRVNGAGATFLGISQDAIGRYQIPMPPRPEQIAISTFLYRETAKIDALLAEQRRLIELLKEKRQAVISHAVTKGLSPDAPMKDSGIEWLGEVPEHWEVKRLKHVSPQITVGIVVEPSKYYQDSGVPALRSLNIQPGKVSMESVVYISEEANQQLAKSKLNEGDLVAVRSGQPGSTAVVPAELDGCNCIDLIVIRKPLVGSEWYLCWYLASDAAIRQFTEGSGGAIQQHFNIGTAMNLFTIVPPSSEQEEIATFLDRETAALDELAAEAQRVIALLQERRTALIAAAVTGKIDVRGLAGVQAPNEALQDAE